MISILEQTTTKVSWFVETIKRDSLKLAIILGTLLAILVIPFQKSMYDTLLAIALACSCFILVMTFFVRKTLNFKYLLSALLMLSLFRLALNVAVTRFTLIISNESLGWSSPIKALYDHFLNNRNFIDMVTIYALFMVNFLIILTGARRISNAAALVTFNEMLGDQQPRVDTLDTTLKINTDITEQITLSEKRKRFFEFIKGVATLIKIEAFVCFLATALIINVMISDNLYHFTVPISQAILQIGLENILTMQLPTLISLAALNYILSKTAAEILSKKVIPYRNRDSVASLILCIFVLGSLYIKPNLSLISLSIILVLACIVTLKRIKTHFSPKLKKENISANNRMMPKIKEDERDKIIIEIGNGLLPLIKYDNGQAFYLELRALWDSIEKDIGMKFPIPIIVNSPLISSHHYSIKIHGKVAANGELWPDKLLAMSCQTNSLGRQEKLRIPSIFKALWIKPSQQKQVEEKGYIIATPLIALSIHLAETLKSYASLLLNDEEVQRLMNRLDKHYQKLINDLVPGHISLSEIKKILKSLLVERVAIRDLATILEGISEAVIFTPHCTTITEHVRTKLAQQLCLSNSNQEGILSLVVLGAEWEKLMLDSLVGENDNKQVSLPAHKLQEFRNKVIEIFEHKTIIKDNPVLLTNRSIRPHVRSIIERFRPLTVVLSQEEIYPKTQVKMIAEL